MLTPDEIIALFKHQNDDKVVNWDNLTITCDNITDTSATIHISSTTDNINYFGDIDIPLTLTESIDINTILNTSMICDIGDNIWFDDIINTALNTLTPNKQIPFTSHNLQIYVDVNTIQRRNNVSMSQLVSFDLKLRGKLQYKGEITIKLYIDMSSLSKYNILLQNADLWFIEANGTEHHCTNTSDIDVSLIPYWAGPGASTHNRNILYLRGTTSAHWLFDNFSNPWDKLALSQTIVDDIKTKYNMKLINCDVYTSNEDYRDEYLFLLWTKTSTQYIYHNTAIFDENTNTYTGQEGITNTGVYEVNYLGLMVDRNQEDW